VANNTWQRFGTELIKGLVITNDARALVTGNRFNWPGDFGITAYSGSNHIANNYFHNSYGSIGVMGNSNFVVGNMVQSPNSASFYSLYVSGATNFISGNWFAQPIRLVGSTAHGNHFANNTAPGVLMDEAPFVLGNTWWLNQLSEFTGDNNTNGHWMTVKTNGYVGMGTNTPEYRLTVAGEVAVTDDPYNATTWNDNGTVPTKNAIRDKIESLSVGGGGGPLSGGFTNGSGALTADGHAMELIDPNTGWTNLNWTVQTLSAANTNVLDWFNKWLIGTWTANGALFTNLNASFLASGTVPFARQGELSSTLLFTGDGTNVFLNAGLAIQQSHQFNLTATNSFVLQITNGVDGQFVRVRVQQDATGNRVGYNGSTIDNGDGPTEMSLSPLPDTKTYEGYIYDADSDIWSHVSESRNFDGTH